MIMFPYPFILLLLYNNQMNNTDYKIEPVKVDYLECIYGFLSFRITVGDKSEEFNFSDVFDPIDKFIAWLESVCTDVLECRFWFDEEGREIRFTYKCWDYYSDKKIFTVAEDYENGKIFLKGYINRHNLVQQFYVGLKTFISQYNFKEDSWGEGVNHLEIHSDIIEKFLNEKGQAV